MIIKFPSYDYTCIRYPAGELQVRIDSNIIRKIHEAETIEIDARVVTAHALIELILLSDAIRGIRPGVELNLNIPYLPYARADRRFMDGDCFGLETFGRLLRVGNFDKINTLDVHNPNPAYTHVSSFLRNYPAMPFIQRAAEDFKPDAILFPDAGAEKRYKDTGYSSIFATKVRDSATGRLSSFTVPDVSRYGRILIVDDICDGGRTFLGITGVIPPGPTFGLYVTHGIFSQGLRELGHVFGSIYTTNSFKDGKTMEVPNNFVTLQKVTCYDAFACFHG